MITAVRVAAAGLVLIFLASQVQGERAVYFAVDLGTLGGATSEAHGINNAGQVVGHYVDDNDELRAFLWAAEARE